MAKQHKCRHQQLIVAGNSPQYWNATTLRPCLFDLSKDPSERNDLSANEPALMRELWTKLNTSWFGEMHDHCWHLGCILPRVPAIIVWTGYFHARSPAELLGPCNEPCAREKWTALNPANLGAPVCAVPGCEEAAEPEETVVDPGAWEEWPKPGASKQDWVGGDRPPRRL